MTGVTGETDRGRVTVETGAAGSGSKTRGVAGGKGAEKGIAADCEAGTGSVFTKTDLEPSLSEADSEPAISIADSETKFSAVVMETAFSATDLGTADLGTVLSAADLGSALSAAGLGSALSAADLDTGLGDKTGLTGTSRILTRRDKYSDRVLAAMMTGISWQADTDSITAFAAESAAAFSSADITEDSETTFTVQVSGMDLPTADWDTVHSAAGCRTMSPVAKTGTALTAAGPGTALLTSAAGWRAIADS
ncbi:hypothetical protein PO909_010455 [Leuciscus waleckii]